MQSFPKAQPHILRNVARTSLPHLFPHAWEPRFVDSSLQLFQRLLRAHL